MTDTIELESAPEAPITDTPVTAALVAKVKASRGRPKKQAPLPGPNGPLRNQQALKHVATLSEYHARGWQCCLIEDGAKGPNYRNWNTEPIAENHVVPLTWGVGLLHALSGTVAIDVDQYDLAKAWLAERNIDLDGLLNAPDAVRIISGRVGSDKLIYAHPAGKGAVPSKKVIVDGKTALEFRCASADGKSVQDIIPHPGYLHVTANTEYRWQGDWRNLPVVPEAIQKLWQELIEVDCSKNVEVRNDGKIGNTKWTTIMSALKEINPDSPRDPWRNVGMALADAANQIGNSEEAFTAWLSWSAQSPKFNPREMRGQWRSFKSDRPDRIRIGTLFHYALETGWKFPDPDLNGMFNVVPPGGDFVDEAVDALFTDDPNASGRLFSMKVIGAIKLIRMTDLGRWNDLRARIKESKKVTPMEMIDKATMPDKASTQMSKAETKLKIAEPWTVPVDGAVLLDDIVQAIRKIVIAGDASIHAAALWTLATYFVSVARFAPILNVTAPEKRCGKSQLLDTLAQIVYMGLKGDGLTSSAIFRLVEKYHPTLLIDEVDRFLNAIAEAIGILNSGVNPTGCVWRCVGDDHEPTPFDTFGFKALAGIGNLADTLDDRSIKVIMRRKFAGESTKNIRHANEREFADLRSRCLRFAQDNLEAYKEVDVTTLLIKEIHDRANDCWEPLFVVASLVGAEWLAKATSAAIDLASDGEAQSVNSELLASVRRAFIVNDVTKIESGALVDTLIHEPGGRWRDFDKGKWITSRQVAAILHGFGIGNSTKRLPKGTVYKALGRTESKDTFSGYERNRIMEEAFMRYLPPLTDSEIADMKAPYEEAEEASNKAAKTWDAFTAVKK